MSCDFCHSFVWLVLRTWAFDCLPKQAGNPAIKDSLSWEGGKGPGGGGGALNRTVPDVLVVNKILQKGKSKTASPPPPYFQALG